jgi:endonuclease/exonuclease/phosphatase family metal-dependent hydrolase
MGAAPLVRAPDAPMSSAIRAATYNVHACVGGDRRRNVGRIIEVLREIDADVIGLQEVESRHGRSDVDQAQIIAAALDLTCIEGPLLRAERGWYGNALLTRLEVASVRRVLFDRYGREPRGAVVCDLLGRDAIRWRVLTTHLDLRTRHRRGQFATLLDELASDPPRPTVLMGDFNEWSPLGRGLALLRDHAELPPAPPTFPSKFPLLRLDRIAHTGCRVQGRVRCHRTPQSGLASDHLPLFADLISLPAARPADAVTAGLSAPGDDGHGRARSPQAGPRPRHAVSGDRR